MTEQDPGRKIGEKNYRYQLRDVQIVKEASLIQSPLIRKYYNWWHSFKPNLPTIQDFEQFPFPELNGNMFRIQAISDDQFKFETRGRIASKLLGGSNTDVIIKTNVDDASTQLEKEHVRLAKYYQAVANNRMCHLCAGTLLTINFMDVGFESLDSPIGLPDGTITHIIGIIDTNPSNLLDEMDGFI